MANPKQVSMLIALFYKAGIHGSTQQLDWLYENGMDVDRLEQLPHSEVQIAVKLLEEKANGNG